MATKSSARFTIDVDGQPRALVSLRASNDDDLFVIIKHAQQFRQIRKRLEMQSEHPLHGKEIAEQRYSVHPSRDMPDMNFIKHTLWVDGAEKDSTVHFTRALKTTGRFAHLFTCMPPHLGQARYLAKREEFKNQSLGSYLPAQYTLAYAVLVSASDRKFIPPKTKLSSFCAVHDMVAGPYRVTVLSTFLPFPSDSNSQLMHTMTLDPKAAQSDAQRQALERGMDGYDEARMLMNFREHCSIGSLEIARLAIQGLPKDMAPIVRETLEMSRPFRRGDIPLVQQPWGTQVRR